MAKKVLVQSVYREVVAKVGETYARDENGRAIAHPVMRQFSEFRCYMTPEQAEFLVESEENRKERAAGHGHYFYPAGIPVPVDENHDGPLLPATSSESFALMNPEQALAAETQTARAEQALQLAEKKARDAATEPVMTPVAPEPEKQPEGTATPVPPVDETTSQSATEDTKGGKSTRKNNDGGSQS